MKSTFRRAGGTALSLVPPQGCSRVLGSHQGQGTGPESCQQMRKLGGHISNIPSITKWALGLTAHNLKRKSDDRHSFSRKSGQPGQRNVHVTPKQQGRHSGNCPQHGEHLHSLGDGVSGQRSHPKENSTDMLVYSRGNQVFPFSPTTSPNS